MSPMAGEPDFRDYERRRGVPDPRIYDPDMNKPRTCPDCGEQHTTGEPCLASPTDQATSAPGAWGEINRLLDVCERYRTALVVAREALDPKHHAYQGWAIGAYEVVCDALRRVNV